MLSQTLRKGLPVDMKFHDKEQPIIVECAAGENFYSKNTSLRLEKDIWGHKLKYWRQKILGTFCQNRDQKGTTFAQFSRKSPY